MFVRCRQRRVPAVGDFADRATAESQYADHEDRFRSPGLDGARGRDPWQRGEDSTIVLPVAKPGTTVNAMINPAMGTRLDPILAARTGAEESMQVRRNRTIAICAR